MQVKTHKTITFRQTNFAAIADAKNSGIAANLVKDKPVKHYYDLCSSAEVSRFVEFLANMASDPKGALQVLEQINVIAKDYTLDHVLLDLRATALETLGEAEAADQTLGRRAVSKGECRLVIKQLHEMKKRMGRLTPKLESILISAKNTAARCGFKPRMSAV